MADDIDDLLDEVEDSLIRSSSSHVSSINLTPNSSKSTPGNNKSDNMKIEDLSDLLEDLDESSLPLPGSHTHTPDSSKGDSSGRCHSPQLGATSVPTGLSSGVTIRACNCLRCLKCDMKVVMKDGFSWIPSTDYLFLRNNYPDMRRLSARLEPKRGSRAYACQCQHYTIADQSTAAAAGLKWVCGGHFS